MSTDKPNPVITVADPSETAEVEPTRRQTVKAFITKHKKPLIAVGLLGAVVGVSAVTGRQAGSSTDVLVLEVLPSDTDEVTVESTDTETA